MEKTKVNEKNVSKNTAAVNASDGDGWTVVKRKSTGSSPSTYSDESPAPFNTFKNLKTVDEVDLKKADGSKLRISQMKKLRRAPALRIFSPQLPQIYDN